MKDEGQRQPVLSFAHLEGERVLLRPLRPEDAAQAFPMIHEREEVLRWLIWKGPASMLELRRMYGRWLIASEEGDNYHLAIIGRESGDFYGSISTRFQGHPFVGDVGYWIGEPHWSRGVASEAVFLVSWLSFRYLGARELIADVFLGNDPSTRVLEKNGFTQDPGTRLLCLPDGREREQYNYRLGAADFDTFVGTRRPVCEAAREVE